MHQTTRPATIRTKQSPAPFRCLSIFFSGTKRHIACAAALAVLTAFSPSSRAEQAGGWEDLFAADLSNAQFPEGVWTFSNGELTASEDQVIWTKNDYENFVLDLEFKTGSDANSGVIVYASDKSQWVPNSVEIQLLDDAGPKWAKADPKWKCGAIFGRLAPSQSVVKPAGEWNHCQITCCGPKIDVVQNGQPVTSFDMTLWRSGTENPDGSKMPPWLNKPLSSHPTKGAIGLQGKHGGAPIWFRNIKIKPLG
jgi:hypothetical protein